MYMVNKYLLRLKLTELLLEVLENALIKTVCKILYPLQKKLIGLYQKPGWFFKL